MEAIRGQRVVLCAPGFPTSSDDADKPFLLDHATALAHDVAFPVARAIPLPLSHLLHSPLPAPVRFFGFEISCVFALSIGYGDPNS